MTLDAVEAALTSAGMHLPVLAKPISTGLSPLQDIALAQSVNHHFGCQERLDEPVILGTSHVVSPLQCPARMPQSITMARTS